MGRCTVCQTSQVLFVSGRFTGDRAALARDCRTTFQACTGTWSSLSRGGKTVKVYGTPLVEADLSYKRLAYRLREFAQPFGKLAPA